jgi:hypothetical protein
MSVIDPLRLVTHIFLATRWVAYTQTSWGSNNITLLKKTAFIRAWFCRISLLLSTPGIASFFLGLFRQYHCISMVQSHSKKTSNLRAGKEITHFYGKWKFITVVTKSHYWIPCSISWIQCKNSPESTSHKQSLLWGFSSKMLQAYTSTAESADYTAYNGSTIRNDNMEIMWRMMALPDLKSYRNIYPERLTESKRSLSQLRRSLSDGPNRWPTEYKASVPLAYWEILPKILNSLTFKT